MRFAVTFLFAASALTAALTQPVPTESGMLKGAPGTDKSITVFKGVPFAAPPVGDKRWRAPEPPVKWEGVRAADAFGANCVQTITREKKPWTYEFMAHGDVSEDCLFLNIWTAAARAGEKRPVFVYLHGGANTEGSGSIDSYNGEGLARKGVLMITVNYRLGVFGFFTHPELTKESDGRGAGNFALMDQMAALRWVKRNIAAFGGDPDRVTVAGQSAGASDIALLLRSPLAKGLFQRAIMESGGAPGNGGARPLAASEADGVKFAAAKGAATLAQLRALSSQEIFAPVTGVRFGPVTDGYVVPSEPYINDVPTLTG
jgi:para-nitrobenzyl esterase